MNIYVGIDPGKSGAIAWLTDDKDGGLHSENTKNLSSRGINDIFSIFYETADVENIHVYLEKVWSFPRDGNKSAFSFGMNYGMWQTLLEINYLPWIDVVPRTWQGHYDIPKMSKKDRKLLCKTKASDYLKEYEEVYKATYSNSDAILLAMYSKEITSPSLTQDS